MAEPSKNVMDVIKAVLGPNPKLVCGSFVNGRGETVTACPKCYIYYCDGTNCDPDNIRFAEKYK